MALNGDTLGEVITAIENDYNEVDIPEQDLPATRLRMNKRIAWAIIEHFKNQGEVLPNTLVAPNGSLTGKGKIN
ncbi:MAG: hypothetical protein EAZ35_02185 [Sphingobacteriia bacterium]|nr:MAG: hypothetical protein EAZ35_02185 [Sphingobacteriia bacterium]